MYYFFIDVPDQIRWERIAQREDVTLEEAAEIDRSKERGKQKSGLSRVIDQADHVLDGNRTTEALAREVIRVLGR